MLFLPSMYQFFKYHGTGNDFVIIDNRNGAISRGEASFFEALCHRRFGIGADGVILLEAEPGYDFGMYYVNADGHPTSMCGNGGRCTVAFAHRLGIIQETARFLAIDGPHEAVLTDRGVKLKMGVPTDFRDAGNGDHFIDTGSPHHIRFLPPASDRDNFDVFNTGKAIREGAPYGKAGSNVNFVWPSAEGLYARTFERGVEDETWSCGTGVTAVAEVYARLHGFPDHPIAIRQPGGLLHVHVSEGEAPWLEGPAKFVFSGHISPDFQHD